MWAHYSNNHKGYCVSYSTDFNINEELSPSLFPVQYLDGRVDITNYLEGFLKHMDTKYTEAIKGQKHEILIDNLQILWVVILTSYIKEKKWEYEQEFRVMKPANVPKSEFIKANPAAIYIGEKCKEEHKLRLVNIAFIMNIPIYQMVVNPASKSFELVPEQINI
ncbi:DUF2971 domain-containing protein [Lysinibacillus sp. NPDC095746]|uniref:DUF2971 domain-containing protein n=1 Tax=Lysinibacillus sp. NPDC095746 TaxID=3364134 RepID=UPI00382F7060